VDAWHAEWGTFSSDTLICLPLKSEEAPGEGAFPDFLTNPVENEPVPFLEEGSYVNDRRTPAWSNH
jgi:hypothetical protein